MIDSGTGWLVDPDTEGDGTRGLLARRRALPARCAVLHRLIPGHGADVTVMADDPVDVGGAELVSLPVLLTVEVVFRGL